MALDYATYLGAVFAAGAALALSMLVLIGGVYRVYDARRKWGVFVDGDTVTMHVKRVRPDARGMLTLGRKALKRTYTFDGNAHHDDDGDPAPTDPHPLSRIVPRILPGKRGGGFIIHQRTGWNLTAPRIGEWAQHGADKSDQAPDGHEAAARHGLSSEQARDLLVSDPWLLANAIDHNDSQDAIGANSEGGDWREKVIPWLVLLGISTLGGIVYLIMQLTQSGVIGGGG